MATLTPIKAIRAKCMDCTCHQLKEIRLCPVTACPIWPYRMGHRPKATDQAEDMQALAEDREAREVEV